MEQLTLEENNTYSAMSYKNANEITKDELIIIVKKALENHPEYLAHINDVVLKTNGNYDSNNHNLNKNVLTITTYKYNNKTDIRRNLSDYMDYGMVEQVLNGKNAESVYPNALELLFKNETPTRELKILDYFIKGKFVYVKTKAKKELKKRSRKHGYYAEHVREMVIEEWGNRNYKVKNKTFTDNFKKNIVDGARAPKAKVIEVKNESTMKDAYSEYQDFAEVLNKKNETEPFVNLQTIYKFHANSWSICETIQPWVVYNSGDKLWVRAVKTNYDLQGDMKLELLPDKFFKINEFGNLSESTTNPVIFHETVDKEKNLPQPIPFINAYSVWLDTNEDETEIETNKFDHIPYIEVKLAKQTPSAKEYHIINLFTERKVISFFANYEDRWIHTTKRNRKVKEMLDVYELADKLSEEGDTE